MIGRDAGQKTHQPGKPPAGQTGDHSGEAANGHPDGNGLPSPFRGGVFRQKGDEVDKDTGTGNAPDEGECKKQDGAGEQAKAQVGDAQGQGADDEKRFPADAVAPNTYRQGKNAGRQREHAGHLSDKVLLEPQAREVKVVEQHEERHSGEQERGKEEEAPDVFAVFVKVDAFEDIL